MDCCWIENPKIYSSILFFAVCCFPISEFEVKCCNELTNIYEWMNANKLTINTTKSQALVIPLKSKLINVNINIAFNQAQLQVLPNLKYLGIYLDKNLNFSKHLNYIESKIARATGILYKCKPYFSSKILRILYYSLFYPHIKYGIVTWGSTYKSYLKR